MLVAHRFRKSLISPVGVHSAACWEAESRFAIVGTGWGECAIVWNNHEREIDAGGFSQSPSHALLSRIILPGLSVSEMRHEILRQSASCDEVLGDGRGNFHPEVVPPWFSMLVRYLQTYYASAMRDWSEPQFVDNWAFWRPRLDWGNLTEFQRQVLEETAQIPCGVQLTYGQVAQRVGRPKASRAVGAALGANPWPVLVPCHRVVGQGGKLTGFSAPGGVGTKRRMLAMEGAGLFSL